MASFDVASDICPAVVVGASSGGPEGAGGEAVHVDPIKPNLKPPGTKRLKLKCDTLLSTAAFTFNLRRYMVVTAFCEDKTKIVELFQRCGREAGPSQ
jgi:hypothetical protein